MTMSWDDAQKKLAGIRFLVVGDLMLDVWHNATPIKVNPEAPCLVAKRQTVIEGPGGAGNVLQVLQMAGATAKILSQIGNDAAAQAILKIVGGNNGMLLQYSGPTTIKERFVVDGQTVLRLDRDGGALGVPDEAVGKVLLLVQGLVDEADIIVLSDYAKRFVQPWLLDILRESRKPIIADSKNPGILNGVDILKVSHHDVGFQTREEQDAGCAALFKRANFVLCTRGAEGAYLYSAGFGRGPLAFKAEADPDDVVDVCGAGDVVTAWLAIGRALGLTVNEACRLAFVAAGLAVTKPRTASAHPIEVFRRFNGLLGSSRGETPGVESQGVVADRCARWAAVGLNIGIANGCFDVMHEGHIRYLEYCKRYCDKLVVLVNSDSSVKALKGDNRPIQPLRHRAAVLSSLRFVDALAEFNDPTPYQMIASIGSGTYFAGYDHHSDEMVAHLEENGVKVERVPKLTEDSTTKIWEGAGRYAN